MDDAKSDDDTLVKTATGDEDKDSEAVKDDDNKNSEEAKIDVDKNSDGVKMDEDKNSEAMKVNKDKTAGIGDSGDANMPVPVSPTPVSPTPQSGSPTARKKKGKVDILFKATGGAPIMKKPKWSVEEGKSMGAMIDFIRRYLKCELQQSIFVYVNQSFAPSPDVAVGVLYECFGADGKLVLHYCMTQAWG